VDGCQSWKLVLETSANFVVLGTRVSGAGFQREFLASVSWALHSTDCNTTPYKLFIRESLTLRFRSNKIRRYSWKCLQI